MDTRDRHVNRRSLIRTTGAALAGAVGASVIHAVPAAAAGFSFTPITPYRSVDIRSGSKLPQGFFEDWDL